MSYQAKQYETALAEIRLAGEAASSNPLPFYIMGMIFRAMGDLNNAAKAYTFALKLDDNFSLAHLDLGLALQQLGNLPLAKEHVSRHLMLSPDTPFLDKAQAVLDAQK